MEAQLQATLQRHRCMASRCNRATEFYIQITLINTVAVQDGKEQTLTTFLRQGGHNLSEEPHPILHRFKYYAHTQDGLSRNLLDDHIKGSIGFSAAKELQASFD